MKNVKYLIVLIVAIIAAACQPDKDPVVLSETEWVSRPDGFEQKYTLEQLVVLSRHNIRSPLVSKNSVLTRLTNSDYQWFPWEGQPSTLTAKGERLEKNMGEFFAQWLDKKELLSKYSETGEAFRFYANAKQRCQLTAKTFAGALLPLAKPEVEMHVEFDTMDPVFNPQITKLTDSFIERAQGEIAEKFGDIDNAIASGYKLIERVIDLPHAPAYPDTSSFSDFPSSVGFELNKEPFMKGGLKMACTVSDALSLQYYEEADEKKAAFGHDIGFEDWTTIASVKEWYGDVLFTAPSVAVNVAHPLLREILSEVQDDSRVFSFLCGHDSNIGSVMAALDAEAPKLDGSIEQRTPIGCKLIFETFTGTDDKEYADVLLVYASAEQLRAESALSYSNPPMAVKVKLKGLKENTDGLYSLSDVEQRLSDAINAYDSL